MLVTVCGPNLSDQRKGEFHVHRAGCGDLRHYGPTGRFGGDYDGWTIEASGRRDVVEAIYGDFDDFPFDDPGDAWQAWDDLWIAPCVTWKED